MSTTDETAIDSIRPQPLQAPTYERASVSGGVSEELQMRRSLTVDAPALSRSVSTEDREAILESLYEERTELTRARRLGTLSPADADYLTDLNRYIDAWEKDEGASSSDVWKRLEAIASSVLSFQVDVERTRK